MDFVSIILTALGWSREHAAKVSERRVEVYKLNAEVAGECLKALSILDLSGPPLLSRLHSLFPAEPEAYEGCTEGLATLRAQCEQLYEMAGSYKQMIENADAWTDWDQAVMRVYQWRTTASSFCPHVEGVLMQFERVIAQEEDRRSNLSPLAPVTPAVFRTRDRGWDAPPL